MPRAALRIKPRRAALRTMAAHFPWYAHHTVPHRCRRKVVRRISRVLWDNSKSAVKSPRKWNDRRSADAKDQDQTIYSCRSPCRCGRSQQGTRLHHARQSTGLGTYCTTASSAGRRLGGLLFASNLGGLLFAPNLGGLLFASSALFGVAQF
jgi:hypothetical protein